MKISCLLSLAFAIYPTTVPAPGASPARDDTCTVTVQGRGGFLGQGDVLFTLVFQNPGPTNAIFHPVSTTEKISVLRITVFPENCYCPILTNGPRFGDSGVYGGTTFRYAGNPDTANPPSIGVTCTVIKQ